MLTVTKKRTNHRREFESVDLDHMTTEDYLAWAPDSNSNGDPRWKYELHEGRVVMSPSAFLWHNRVVGYVWARLDRFVRKHHLGIVCFDVDSVVDRAGNTVVRPDVFFVAKSRVSIYAEEGNLRDAADLVIEVTSESTRHTDFREKHAYYESNPNVHEYWILDIVREPMEAYLWYRSRGEFAGGKIRGPKLKSKLLKGFELDLKKVWAEALEGRA